LSKATIDVSMNKEQPWTIEPWHIRASARKGAINIKDDSCIEMPPEKISGPDLSLEGKEFYVTVTINNKEKVNVRCRIHHWSTEPGERIHSISPWFKKAEPVFAEQAVVLEKIPLPIEKPKVKKIAEFK
jgi:large subunit ribosomal protein L9